MIQKQQFEMLFMQKKRLSNIQFCNAIMQSFYEELYKFLLVYILHIVFLISLGISSWVLNQKLIFQEHLYIGLYSLIEMIWFLINHRLYFICRFFLEKYTALVMNSNIKCDNDIKLIKTACRLLEPMVIQLFTNFVRGSQI